MLRQPPPTRYRETPPAPPPPPATSQPVIGNNPRMRMPDGTWAELPNSRRRDTTPAPSPGQESARAIIEAALKDFGLQGLGQWAWDEYIRTGSIERVFLDLRDRPEYKARFPGMDALAKKGRAISEAQYIDLERSYAQVARAAGLPQGFYDGPDDFTKLITNEVSPQEWSDRVGLATAAAYQSPPQLRQELARLYGMGPGELTAYFIDPDRALPMLQQQFVAGQVSTAASTTGYGTLTREEAEGLAGMGVTEQRATEGFGQLAEGAALFESLPGTGEKAIDRETQLSATFGGNAKALERIRRRQAERRGVFQSGGRFVGDEKGVGGLGSAAS